MKNIKLLAALLLCLCATQNFSIVQRRISNTPIRDFVKRLSEEFYAFLTKKSIASTDQQTSENTTPDNTPHETPLTQCGYTQDELEKMRCAGKTQEAHGNCNKANPDYALSLTSKNNGVRTNLGVLR